MIETATYHKTYRTSCGCDKKTIVEIDIITSDKSTQHNGVAVTVHPNVCPCLPLDSPFRKSSIACNGGMQMPINNTETIEFRCTDKTDHSHSLVTKVIKLDPNPSLDLSSLERVQTLPKTIRFLKSILSTPNLLPDNPEGLAPYGEARKFTITLNREGCIEKIESGQMDPFIQVPIPRTDPTFQECPTTEFTISFRRGKGATERKKGQTLAIFQADQKWQGKRTLSNRITLHVKQEERRDAVSVWRRSKKVDKLAESPIVVHPIDDLDEFVCTVEMDEVEMDEEDERLLDDLSSLPPPPPPSDAVQSSTGMYSLGADFQPDAINIPTASSIQVSGSEKDEKEREIERLKDEIKQLKDKLIDESEIVAATEDADTGASTGTGTGTGTGAGTGTGTSTGTGAKESTADIMARIEKLYGSKGQANSQPPKLPPFDASAMGLKTWIDALAEVFSAYPNLDRRIAVSQVILALKEPLLSTFLMIIEADTDKQKGILELLKDFADNAFVENNRLNTSLFSQRSQLSNESVEEFHNSLTTLARNAFSSQLNNDQIKSRIMERFLSGLREPIGSKVRTQLPKTLKDALMLSTVIESEFNKTRQVYAIQPVKSREMNRTRYVAKAPSNRATTERRFRKKSPNRTTVHDVTPSTETRKCFFCNTPGHIARDCRKKAEKKAQSAQKATQSLNYKPGPRYPPK